MIEPDEVKIVSRPTKAVDPPRISALRHRLPSIKWIAPALSVFAEKVRGHPRNYFRLKFGIETKQMGMSPDVGAVEIHKDRDIADDVDGLLYTVGAQGLPLFVKKELKGATHSELVLHFGVSSGDGNWITTG